MLNVKLLLGRLWTWIIVSFSLNLSLHKGPSSSTNSRPAWKKDVWNWLTLLWTSVRKSFHTSPDLFVLSCSAVCRKTCQRWIFSICLFDRQDNWLSVTPKCRRALGFFSGFRFHEVLSLQGCKSTNTSRTTGINGLIWLKLNYTVTFPSSFFKSSSNKPTWCWLGRFLCLHLWYSCD